jgi:hypothetical protein
MRPSLLFSIQDQLAPARGRIIFVLFHVHDLPRSRSHRPFRNAGIVLQKPHRVAVIYAAEAALAEIARFGGLTMYKLACSSLDFEAYECAGLPLAAVIGRGDTQLCDPPNPGCCRDGPSTGYYNPKILQDWCRRSDAGTWTRDPSLEIDLRKTRTWRGAW